MSRYSVLCGRQPAMLPDLPVLDHSREQTLRRVCIEAIAQAVSVAKTSRALRTRTTITGQHDCDEGNLVDYHRPTTTMDDGGGWNGPFPVVKNDPERGQVIIRVGNRDVQVQHGGARRSL
eukprot:250829-Pyramimonas_sp.AAC.1